MMNFNALAFILVLSVFTLVLAVEEEVDDLTFYVQKKKEDKVGLSFDLDDLSVYYSPDSETELTNLIQQGSEELTHLTLSLMDVILLTKVQHWTPSMQGDYVQRQTLLKGHEVLAAITANQRALREVANRTISMDTTPWACVWTSGHSVYLTSKFSTVSYAVKFPFW
jgi:hypothetical protein